MEEDVTELQDYLKDLNEARTAIVQGGAVKTVRKGDFLATYTSLSELTKEIRQTKEKIALLESNL